MSSSSGVVYQLSDFVRGEVDVLEGKTGLLNLVVMRHVLGRLSTGEVKLKGRYRRHLRLGSSAVLRLPVGSAPDAGQTA